MKLLFTFFDQKIDFVCLTDLTFFYFILFQKVWKNVFWWGYVLFDLLPRPLLTALHETTILQGNEQVPARVKQICFWGFEQFSARNTRKKSNACRNMSEVSEIFLFCRQNKNSLLWTILSARVFAVFAKKVLEMTILAQILIF